MARRIQWRGALPAALVVGLCACGGGSEAPAGGQGTDGRTGEEIRVTLGAYTTPREAYREIIELFQTDWTSRTGQTVIFEESYLGSGAQSRAVIEGFEADVVALSLEADVARIANEGLITHDWKALHNDGIVSTSIVVVAVRAGNPESIDDWHDLAKPGLEVLTPDPMTSGGAQWNVLAMYGAAHRDQVRGYEGRYGESLARWQGFEEGSGRFVKDVFRNVTVLDKSARDSIINYEKGVGDVAITYENEVLVGRQAGQTYEYIVPRSTILIENPAAVVDANVDAHDNRAVAEAFRDFLWTPAAQRVFARHGLRPVDPTVAEEVKAAFPTVDDLFTVQQEFQGWEQVTEPFFGEDGLYIKMLEDVQRGG